jgi:hypothetical protein
MREYALVRGYRLAVPGGWYGLAGWELAALQNGIGPDRWPECYRWVLDAATGFRAAADVHDVDYCLGRTRKDRLVADRRFFANCLRVVLVDAGGWGGLLWRTSWRLAAVRLVLARGLYRALRLGGRQAFVVSTKLDVAVRGQQAMTVDDDLYEGEV